MSCFVDTSAVYALLDADDVNHLPAKGEWRVLLERDETLATTNYVLVETLALLQHRLGLVAVRTFQDDILPLLTVEWVDPAMHSAGTSALLAAQRRGLSLVDCVSFESMRRLGVRDVFAFDTHFGEQGFLVRPAPPRRRTDRR
ncbi:MAG: twitching motility protein PilT [Lentisphaerae bacterium RIFOXYB12_FULL_65_16]|nr:MAG: twitching motility protein PilT [Lentisphaerae bacterium RIFOXYA12_64_32]OGV87409.1 MAG: twitching motility protein PilT [Lentisphaerae bacterium RIFOXYB12_FULL_65_16]